jgi:hypothetical protein
MSTESIDDSIKKLEQFWLEHGGENPVPDYWRAISAEETNKYINDLIKQSQLEELEKAREWCAGGQMCEYSKLVDRIEALNRIKEGLDDKKDKKLVD